MRPLSVGSRLALVNAAVVAAATVAAGFVLFAVVDAALLRGADGILRDEIQEVAEILRRDRLDVAAVRGVLEEEIAGHGSERLSFRIHRADGSFVAQSDSPIWDALPAVSGSGSRPPRVAKAEGDPVRHRVITRRVATASFGPVDLEGAMRLRAADAALEDLRRDALLLLPAALLAAVAAGYFLARRSLAPVAVMESTARRIGIGAPGERIPGTGTGDEFDRLAGTLNDMLARLEEASARNLRFAGDVAHEVRTPLAALRTRLESALAGAADLPAVARERLEAGVREVDRVDALVRSLLLICRADEGAAGAPRAPLDLTALLREVGGFFAPLAASRGIRLDVDAPEGLRAPGDAAVLQRAVANLVDNALHYTGSGGSVRLHGFAEDGRVLVEVEDDGIGVPEASRGRVFDRFFRGDAARERNPGGSGLGLALVRAVARAHGGEAEYSARPGGGSLFRIRLPRDTRPVLDPRGADPLP